VELLVIPALLALGVALFARHNVHTGVARRAWNLVARELGAPPPGPGTLQLDLELDGVCVRAKVGPPAVTTVRARYALCAGPRFEIVPHGLSTDLDARMGNAPTDLVIDDLEFDERFLVHGDSVAEVRAAWSSRARALRLRLPAVRVHSDGVFVELVHYGLVDDVPTLDGSIRLVAELANSGVGHFAALTALPGAVVHPASGGFDDRVPPRIELPLLSVYIGPALAGGQRVTLVRGPRGRRLRAGPAPRRRAGRQAARGSALDRRRALPRRHGARPARRRRRQAVLVVPRLGRGSRPAAGRGPPGPLPRHARTAVEPVLLGRLPEPDTPAPRGDPD
jgi:hypothetical protein